VSSTSSAPGDVGVKRTLGALFDPAADLWVLASQGLTGLTDGEYWWEPVAGCWSIRPRNELVNPDDVTWGDSQWGLDIVYPDPQPAPFTTIAWRLAHMTGSVLAAAAVLRNRRLDDGGLDQSWPHLRLLPLSASAAVDRWHTATGALREHLADATDEDLESVVALGWSAPAPAWRHVHYLGYFEPASHAAEVRLIRDLYRASDGGRAPLLPPRR